MYSLYWIKKPSHNNPLTEGYIGITKNLKERLQKHTSDSANPMVKAIVKNNDYEIKILKRNMSEWDARRVELSMRPHKNIGYNLAEGGGMPPNRKGMTSDTHKLRGFERTDNQKRASSEHSERMKGRTPWNKGKTGVQKHATKECIYRGIKFSSMTEAANHFGVTISAVSRWNKKHGG